MKLVKENIIAAGIMTGNSLDAVDCLASEFSATGIKDLAFVSKKYPAELAEKFRFLRACLVQTKGSVLEAEKLFNSDLAAQKQLFDPADKNKLASLHQEYLALVIAAVRELQAKLQQINAAGKIELIGFHGQTVGHYPPSIASNTDNTPAAVYTNQFGSGQFLADALGCPVVYDFRSDDLINGGEGAPLAPQHHAHLAEVLSDKAAFPIAFCNAGNSGNISLIYKNQAGALQVCGWDTGPFNHFADLLMRTEKSLPFDENGQYGKRGKVNLELLKALFEKSVVTDNNQNFLLKSAPKSSDPMWYKTISEITTTSKISFEDRLRTVEYFSAYIFCYSLKFVPSDLPKLACFALCGGGWKNQVILGHFQDLIIGNFVDSPILPEHQEVFRAVSARFSGAQITTAAKLGFDGQAMEARLFADAAVCRLINEPFSRPEITGVKAPTVLGYLVYPQQNPENCSERFKTTRADFKTKNNLEVKNFSPTSFWNRAISGWSL